MNKKVGFTRLKKTTHCNSRAHFLQMRRLKTDQMLFGTRTVSTIEIRNILETVAARTTNTNRLTKSLLACFWESIERSPVHVGHLVDNSIFIM